MCTTGGQRRAAALRRPPPSVSQLNRNPRPQLEPQISSLEKCKIKNML